MKYKLDFSPKLDVSSPSITGALVQPAAGTHFVAWQPSSWPPVPAAVDEKFVFTLKRIFEESILGEIENVMTDVMKVSGDLESLDWQYNKATRDAYMKSPPDSDERDRIMQDGYMRNLCDFFERHKSMLVPACRGTRGAVREKHEFLAQYHNTELKRFLSDRKDLRVRL